MRELFFFVCLFFKSFSSLRILLLSKFWNCTMMCLEVDLLSSGVIKVWPFQSRNYVFLIYLELFCKFINWWFLPFYFSLICTISWMLCIFFSPTSFNLIFHSFSWSFHSICFELQSLFLVGGFTFYGIMLVFKGCSIILLFTECTNGRSLLFLVCWYWGLNWGPRACWGRRSTT
jgi:hypothetical protein